MPQSSTVERELRALRATLPPLELHHLTNGLTVGILRSDRVPLVATSLVYRVGARDEIATELGIAHFLEHMMFKGSAHFGPGEIDRKTRSLGGSNNAFTSQDSTLYYFTFAADRWREALAIEADRMTGLTLDPAEVDSERQVILEELAMYEGEPWDALDRQVSASFFGSHPYGRPVIGTRETLAATGAAELGGFHRRYYQPSNAVLVLVGDVGSDALAAVEEAFGDIAGCEEAAPVRTPGEPEPLRNLVRLQRHQGEVPRLLLKIPAPPAEHPDHPALTLLSEVLSSGRASRLVRRLVDEGQLCGWVSSDLQESPEAGALVFALELIPGVTVEQAESALLEEIARLGDQGPSREEIERARKILVADWIFGHEKINQQAFLMATDLALWDAERNWRYFDRVLRLEPDELQAVAGCYLRPSAGGVLGWSLPVGNGRLSGDPS